MIQQPASTATRLRNVKTLLLYRLPVLAMGCCRMDSESSLYSTLLYRVLYSTVVRLA
eukprot:COSAG06_NODE_1495_length_9262_cov_21.163779_9_plen_57_part_00